MRTIAALATGRASITLGGVLILAVGVSEFAAGAICQDSIFKDGFESGAHPVATIFSPGDGETRPAATPVVFVGGANDPEDGALSGAALVWCSDLDGEFGTGGSLNAMLSAGQHIVTLSATDSDGNTGADQISLTMTP
jgi:hypothetical protein